MIAEKQKPIRKLKRARKFRKQKPQLEQKPVDEPVLEKSEVVEEVIVTHEQQNQEPEELPPIKFLNIPIKDVAYMPEEERTRLKNQHPNLAQYIFMSQRQRTKFFHQKNLSYGKQMQTPGNLPARKIQFKRKFQVRLFDMQQCAEAVNSKKSKKQKYNPKVHYS